MHLAVSEVSQRLEALDLPFKQPRVTGFQLLLNA